MPRTPQQFESMRADAEERLVRAALVVFARKGYTTATVADIAREAGVAQGLLYRYFDSKQALLLGVFERGMADVALSFAAGTAGRTPQQRLEQLIRAAFDGVHEHLDFWRLIYAVRYQPDVVQALTDRLEEWQAFIISTLASHLRSLGHGRARSARLATTLFAAIDGAAQHFALQPDSYPVRAVAQEIVAFACHPPAR